MPTQHTVTSADGTTIAVSRSGSGPAVVLVDGALCYRGQGPATKLAEALQGDFTVHTYDRRGRGESTDTKPYSIDAEAEDLAAVIQLAGGTADVYGISSGAILAIEGAARKIGVRKLAVYEAPVITDDSRAPIEDGMAARMERLVQEGKRGEAVSAFMRSVGVPGFFLRIMKLMPVWSKLTGVAHTLPYDFTLLDGLQAGRPLPQDRWTTLSAPTLAMAGGKSPAWMQQGNRELGAVLPSVVEFRTIPGQTHMLKASAIAPVLRDFFRS